MNPNIFEMQYKIVQEIAHKLIKGLKEQEGIFIIDKDMNLRVLFYYKPDTLFISESFSVKNVVNYVYSSESFTDICEYVSLNFDESEEISNSKLVKNIDKFISEYMINNFCIHVNRAFKNILGAYSLTFYNNLFLLNLDGFYKLFRNDNGIIEKYCIDSLVSTLILDTDRDYFEQLFDHIYKNYMVFPSLNNILETPTELCLEDLKISKTSNHNPVLFMTSCASNMPLYYQKINTNDFSNREVLYDAIVDILNLKSLATILDDVNDIIDLSLNIKNKIIN